MDESRFSQLHVCEDDEVVDQYSDRDRLSELPDSLILSILSCLSMFDVVRTTILSKRWKDLWATIPCLNFCFSDDHLTNCVNSYGDFISCALAKWRGAKMLKFSLSSDFDLPLNSDIDYDLSFHCDIHLWLLLAIEKQVEEIFIDLNIWNCHYFTPQSLYSCSSITKLSFAIRNLKIESKVQWNNLKSLTIRVKVSLSEDVMNQVLSGAPHLEELILIFLKISVNFNIRSTSLKTLKIDSYVAWPYNCTAVLGIWAPNLVALELSGLNYCGFSLVVPSLTNAILSLQKSDWKFMSFENFDQVFRSISHVEKITLSEWCVKFLLDMMKNTNMDVPISNAKFLKFYVHGAGEILHVFVIFPKLMHTIVHHRDNKDVFCFELQLPEHTVESCFRCPSVEITWRVGDASVIRVMEYLLEKAHKLEKMVLRLRMDGANPEKFVLAEEKVRSLPRSSPTAQLIITKIS